MQPTVYNLPPGYKGDTWLGPEFKLTTIVSTHTSGTLDVASEYVIQRYRIGDSFTNVGATENEEGQLFTASGTTPTTWTKKSKLAKVTRVNLTAATIRMQIYDGTTVVKTITSSSGITVTSAANGEFNITDFIPTTSGQFVYDLQVTFASGVVKTYFRGNWLVVDDVTQNS